MERVSSFQAEIDQLLVGEGKGVGEVEDGQVGGEFEGMSGWWSNDQSNSTSNWDYYQDYAN